MTGAGIVLPDEDAAEVERRLAAIDEELQPTSGLERELAKRVVLATIRLDRLAEQEARATAHRMRVALKEFDDARLAEVEHLLDWIASAPETNARRLRSSPEGLARLIAAIEGLRADLAHPSGFRWNVEHCDRLHNLTGRRYTDIPITRIRALTEAIHGRFEYLEKSEAAELSTEDRRRWAIAELVDLMDAETVSLKAQLEGFDRKALDEDRAEAPARAMFDGSKEGILARKYEAASERALFRALRELKEIRGGSTQINIDKELVPDSTEELGSSSLNLSGISDTMTSVDLTLSTETSPAIRKRPDLEKMARKGRRRGEKR